MTGYGTPCIAPDWRCRSVPQTSVISVSSRISPGSRTGSRRLTSRGAEPSPARVYAWKVAIASPVASRPEDQVAAAGFADRRADRDPISERRVDDVVVARVEEHDLADARLEGHVFTLRHGLVAEAVAALAERGIAGLPLPAIDRGAPRAAAADLDVQVPGQLVHDLAHAPAGLLGRREVDVQLGAELDAPDQPGVVALAAGGLGDAHRAGGALRQLADHELQRIE